MLTATYRRYLNTLVLLASVLTTVTVSPRGSIDPINLPKLCILIVLGSSVVGLLAANSKIFVSSIYRVPVLLSSIFLAQLIVVFLLDDRDLGLKSYGVFGRNTGFLAYFFLTVIFLASVFLASQQFSKGLALAFMGMGCSLAIYGLFQKLGYDLYQFQNLYGTNVFGTLGNPNFHSALMGMTAAVVLMFGLFSKLRVFQKCILLLLGVLALWNIRWSSEQGYLVFIASLSVGLLMFLFMTRKMLFAWIALAVSTLGGICVGLALFNVGPASRFIYGSSIEVRGFYWRAAINLITENPLLGSGFDSYGDWYRRGRTQEIADFNPSIAADSAHNIPLDIAVNGGVPLLLAYLAIQVFVLVSIIKIVRKSTNFEINTVILIAIWTGFQVQSLISINSIGVGVWGWISSGAIIGYLLNTQSAPEKSTQTGSSKSAESHSSKGLKLMIFIVLFGLLGSVIALAPYRAANGFLTALKSQNVESIISSASIKPYDRYRFLYVADILIQNQKNTEALQILNEGVEIFPDSFEIWRLIYLNPATPANRITKAKSELHRLDPHNPEWS